MKDGSIARVAAFVLLFAAMQSLYGMASGTWVERLVIDQLTVRPAAWLIGMFDPALGVEAAGPRLRAGGGGINVLNGCEGTDVVFLLTAALLVSPLTWRRRLAGVAAGAALVLLLNQARVIALFYAFRTDRGRFDMLHGVVTPALLMVAAAAFFLAWARPRPASAPAP
ncbi:MAG: exosortase/archaeosortase family protein [Aquabacterium sp.]|jgi:exosortase/archaeosortase family protein|nr:MAG: exosortase/archaeosortase family protein [Aquabacterium sp.]